MLVIFGGKDAYEALLAATLRESQSYEIRRAAVTGLHHFKISKPDARLKELLNSPNDLLKATAAIYLSNFDDSEMLSHLVTSILTGDLKLLEWATVVKQLERKTGQDFAIASIGSDPQPRLNPRILVKKWAIQEGIIK